MINWSFDKPRLIAKVKNISYYEKKSKEDLIKALKPQKSEPETPKPEPKPEPEAKVEIRVNKTKSKKLGKDFDEFRHKFCKKEIKEYRKPFYKLKSTKIILYQK